MAKDKLPENLTEEQKLLGSKVFDLVLGRVLKRIYLDLDGKDREDMEKVFLSGDDKAMGMFLEKNIPGSKKVFEEEAKKIEEEIKAFILS